MSVVACKNGEFYTFYTPDCAMKHSVLLMEKIDEAFEKLQMTAKDCDFFASVIGAGSFTGIRIGISAIKGFCLATGKPSLAVTSFDTLAYNAIDGAGKEKILCLVNALHGYYYACGYEKGEVVYPPAYLTEEEVLALVKEGYKLVSCQFVPIAEKAEFLIVDPVSGLEKAAVALAEKNAFAPLTALYVRKSSAEINLGK